MNPKFKVPVTNSAWRFLKVINDLGLGRTFHLLWNVYPAMQFMERHYRA